MNDQEAKKEQNLSFGKEIIDLVNALLKLDKN